MLQRFRIAILKYFGDHTKIELTNHALLHGRATAPQQRFSFLVSTAGDLRALTAEAFIYGFPLVFNLGQVDRFVREGMGAMPAAGWNRFAHARALAGPHDTFVSINNDTVYTVAALDLSGGPLRLEVPDAADRYYVLQFVDAWTNNFVYVGRRATGTSAGSFLLVPPG